MAGMISGKRLQIDKANTTVTIVVAIASFLTIGSLMMARGLLIRQSYQAKVISEKRDALKQLEANVAAVDQLKKSYADFVDEETNVIGGLKDGTNGVLSERDGDNAKITLDALPSKYDFPAVTSSLEKLLIQRNFKITGIGGTDDEIAQKDKVESNPTAIEMPFNFTVTSTYDPIVDLLVVLEKSIRPINVHQITITAQDKTVQLELNAKTFYLPEKTLNITTKAIQ